MQLKIWLSNLIRNRSININHLVFHVWEQILKNKYENSLRMFSEDFECFSTENSVSNSAKFILVPFFHVKTFGNWTTGPIVRSRISIQSMLMLGGLSACPRKNLNIDAI